MMCIIMNQDQITEDIGKFIRLALQHMQECPNINRGMGYQNTAFMIERILFTNEKAGPKEMEFARWRKVLETIRASAIVYDEAFVYRRKDGKTGK